MLDLSYELIVRVLKLCKKHHSVNLFHTSKIVFSLRQFILLQLLYEISLSRDHHIIHQSITGLIRVFGTIKPKIDKYISCRNKNKKNKSVITHMKYHNHFNENIQSLPLSVTHIKFGESYNKIFNRNQLPTSITFINFGDNFNSSIDNLPQTITCLIFGFKFNQSVDKLPESLLHLYFGEHFNNPVNKLPNNLLTLMFDYRFDCNIDMLPNKLKRIKLGNKFNKPINKLPLSIEQMICNCEIRRFNLPNLKYLILLNFYNSSINDFPQLTHLCMSGSYQDMSKLPKSLTHLKLYHLFYKKKSAMISKNIKFICSTHFCGCYNFTTNHIVRYL
jgi:hypothetical protein